ncbi:MULTISPECIES: type II toxin-antitoxin system RelE/ParE family toxin [unclassified Caballeronia]|uniref:type II toxin-antitoxin system RelE/ParE family toxin n=1 Tax=unclassified Caballeronia TaxID=2646786 RepID=UPI002866523E|nr:MULTISPECIES: type II toxin-antitoxin system RelE/ParE family toxin [unclassified Caballeronia]MDR5752509.1 type II toxin-antitoxin system RelE/ParE family toxin [Caballeronia sp. LZ024]MDR5841665.1 type II toxin-antitoxin system RelE/ParE family toxin [Caballeronia sp. LZ031]
MARLILAPEIREDFDRIFDFLFKHTPEHAAARRIDDIVCALDILQSSPLIGRPAESPHGMRELVISTGAHGYLALYRFVPELDAVFVTAVRSQRELRYRRSDDDRST